MIGMYTDVVHQMQQLYNAIQSVYDCGTTYNYNSYYTGTALWNIHKSS